MRRSETVTEMSPPRISRAWVARPRRKAAAVELAAAMAATPSARQARKTRKPRTPERSSRAAKRKDSRAMGSGARNLRFDHAPIGHARHAVGAGGQVLIVGAQHQGRAGLRRQV